VLYKFTFTYLFTYRIELSRWNPGEPIVGKVDAHLPNQSYIRSEWIRLISLSAALLGRESDNFARSLDYCEKFSKALLEVLGEITA